MFGDLKEQEEEQRSGIRNHGVPEGAHDGPGLLGNVDTDGAQGQDERREP